MPVAADVCDTAMESLQAVVSEHTSFRFCIFLLLLNLIYSGEPV